jgi:1-acyl-sn-glycerol-3-phosphate acyltransferase
VYLGLVLVTGLLPLLLLGTLVIDVVRAVQGRGRFAVTRLLLFGWWYLVAEVLGLTSMLLFWIVTGFGRRRQAYVSLSYALQSRWAAALFGGFTFLMQIRVEVEGLDQAAPGPMILMMRHASMVDTPLPIVLVMRGRGIRMRYVMKRELLWDPALDVAGNVIPNYFIDRRSDDRAAEVAHIAALAEDLGDEEAVVIYPEGTRYTAEKRERVLRSLARKDPAAAARAAEFHHVLPPRPGGPVALLEAGTDVVMCAHVGLDESAEVRHLLDGSLVGTRVQVAFWRIPAGEIPEGEAGRMEWLTEEWRRVDRWVGDRHGEP